MATVLLVRHGRSTANTDGILAGRLPGVTLDEVGEEQAAQAAERIAVVPLVSVVSSPQQRCTQTARKIARAQSAPPRVLTERGLSECDYGAWQGQALKALAKEPLWKVVQTQPSAAVFPEGESMAEMQRRAVEAVRRRDAEVQAEHGADAVWVAVSHGDLIKSVLADALGLHLDLFQRIHVDPASVSMVRYTDSRPLVLGSNTHAGDLSWLAPRKRRGRRRRTGGDAAVGGGAGPPA